MDTLNDYHGVESIRQYVRSHPDIDVHTFINRGNNGLVYFGRHRKLAEDVVLKFYWSYPNYDASEEAVILRQIDHPNILKVYDLRFIPPHNAYFLSPRISGGDLQSHIDSRPISTKDALKFVAGILLGVTELHAKHSLVHRDLKPGNILIDLNKGMPIIADLGAVKKIHSANGYTTESKATLCYLPPEAIIDRKYFFESDLYQVGLILFQLLDGFFPVNEPSRWLNKNEKQLLNASSSDDHRFNMLQEFLNGKICNGKLANLNTLPNHLDGLFKKVLKKALHPDYTRRYKSAPEFLDAIHKLLNSCPSYHNTATHLLIEHASGKQYRITESNGEFVLEKKLPKKEWRKDKARHDGSFESALAAARIR